MSVILQATLRWPPVPVLEPQFSCLCYCWVPGHQTRQTVRVKPQRPDKAVDSNATYLQSRWHQLHSIKSQVRMPWAQLIRCAHLASVPHSHSLHARNEHHEWTCELAMLVPGQYSSQSENCVVVDGYTVLAWWQFPCIALSAGKWHFGMCKGTVKESRGRRGQHCLTQL